MKGKIALAVGLSVLVATPATAASVYATWEDCMAVVAANDPFDQWEPRCVANPDGTWKIAWTQVKKKKK